MSLRCLGALAQRAGVRARFHNSTACRAMSSYQLLSYEYVHDILEKRGPHRDAHLTAAKEKAQEGKLVLAGATGDPTSGAVFIWKDTTAEAVKAFVHADPYTKAGLIDKWSVTPYNVVVNALEGESIGDIGGGAGADGEKATSPDSLNESMKAEIAS